MPTARSTLRRLLWRMLRVLVLAFAGLGPGMPPPPPPAPAPTEQVVDGDREE